jgi:PHD/YefM family antitoxin component YafN of YafNO toxin-antitoxin module
MLGKSIRAEAKEAIDVLSEKKVSVVLDFIDYLKEREEWEATVELFSDKRLLRNYKKARKEIRKGKTVKWRSIKRNV